MAKGNVQMSLSIATTDEPEARPDVITKYRTTADITNEVLKQVIARCVSGVDVHTLCTFGDSLIEEKVEKVYARRESNQKVN
jgi:methionine aminopeptidase